MSGKSLDTINSLTRDVIDSARGYREAAQDSQAGRFAAIFRARAQEREQMVERLQDYVLSNGGTVSREGTIAAAAHRAWMGLREALSSSNETAIVEEVERGEDHLKAQFEDALADDDLSPSARQLVASAYQQITAAHDQASALKHGLKAEPRPTPSARY